MSPIAGAHSPKSESLEWRWRNRLDEEIRVSVCKLPERIEECNAIFNGAQLPMIAAVEVVSHFLPNVIGGMTEIRCKNK